MMAERRHTAAGCLDMLPQDVLSALQRFPPQGWGARQQTSGQFGQHSRMEAAWVGTSQTAVEETCAALLLLTMLPQAGS
jgi:hypothetical protein